MAPMKNIIFGFLFLLSFSLNASVAILSDLDDTIKITEAGGNPTDIIGDDVYTGMPEFFQGAKEYAPDLYILSASPSFMRGKIEDTLSKRRIKYRGLVLRKNIFEDKFEYKVKEIRRIMDSTSDDFIFVGDDLGKDPEVYAEIKRLYPARFLGSYIHVVNGRRFPTNANIPYFTSFDLALREHMSSRIDAAWIERIAQRLLGERDLSMIFPIKAQCPSEAAVWEWQTRTVFQREALELSARFIRFCQARRSDIIPN